MLMRAAEAGGVFREVSSCLVLTKYIFYCKLYNRQTDFLSSSDENVHNCDVVMMNKLLFVLVAATIVVNVTQLAREVTVLLMTTIASPKDVSIL